MYAMEIQFHCQYGGEKNYNKNIILLHTCTMGLCLGYVLFSSLLFRQWKHISVIFLLKGQFWNVTKRHHVGSAIKNVVVPIATSIRND